MKTIRKQPTLGTTSRWCGIKSFACISPPLAQAQRSQHVPPLQHPRATITVIVLVFSCTFFMLLTNSSLSYPGKHRNQFNGGRKKTNKKRRKQSSTWWKRRHTVSTDSTVEELETPADEFCFFLVNRANILSPVRWWEKKKHLSKGSPQKGKAEREMDQSFVLLLYRHLFLTPL